VDFGPDGLLPPSINRLMGLAGFVATADGPKRHAHGPS
jgi:hypothetical protein